MNDLLYSGSFSLFRSEQNSNDDHVIEMSAAASTSTSSSAMSNPLRTRSRSSSASTRTSSPPTSTARRSTTPRPSRTKPRKTAVTRGAELAARAEGFQCQTHVNKAERDHDTNINLPGDGFDTIARIKTSLEIQCPGVVSCTDIISATTRNLLSMAYKNEEHVVLVKEYRSKVETELSDVCASILKILHGSL